MIVRHHQNQQRNHSERVSHSNTPEPSAPQVDAAPPQPFSPAGSKDVITIGEYNVENMFTNKADPGCELGDTKPKSPQSMAAAAAMLQRTDADVVALEEVQNKQILDEFVDKYMQGNPYPYRVLVPGNDHRGINVALLSKYPISNVVTHKDNQFPVPGGQHNPDHFSRDFLQADVKINDKTTVTMGVVHLKAHAGGAAANAKRLAEANEIRRILLDEMKSYPSKKFVVTGDFNDPAGSPALNAIMGNSDPKFVDPMAGSSEVTHPPTHRRIDFMLLSPDLANSMVPDSAHVVNGPEARQGSDHVPMIAKFKVD